MWVFSIFSVCSQAASSSLILCGIFSVQRCLHRKVMLMLLPVALSWYFVESFLWGQRKQANTVVDQTTMFFTPNNREQYFIWKQCSQVFLFHKKRLFSAWYPLLAISETFFFSPHQDWDGLWHLRKVDTSFWAVPWHRVNFHCTFSLSLNPDFSLPTQRSLPGGGLSQSQFNRGYR